jgi:hypothetical protein
MNERCSEAVEHCLGLNASCLSRFGRCIGDAINDVDCILRGPTLSDQIEERRRRNELERLERESRAAEQAQQSAPTSSLDQDQDQNNNETREEEQEEGGNPNEDDSAGEWPIDETTDLPTEDNAPPMEQEPSENDQTGEGEVVEAEDTQTDSNPGDPEAESTTTEPEFEDDIASGGGGDDNGGGGGGDGELEEQSLGLRSYAKTWSAAARIGGSCTGTRVLQCGVRQKASFCRCIR